MIIGQSRSSPAAAPSPMAHTDLAAATDEPSPLDPSPYAGASLEPSRLSPSPLDPSSMGAVAPDAGLRRRRIRHDIRHELGTIIMLASAVAVSDDLGPASRERIEALLGETRWLDHLLQQLDDEDVRAAQSPPIPERLRVDELVGEIVAGLRLASIRRVGYTGRPAWAHIDPLALWRAVRNVLDNACRIAGRHIDVRVMVEDGSTIIQVDDDGPGFGAGAGGLASLGLGIVHDLVTGYGGGLEIHRGELGGARVRILLPSAAKA